MVQDGDGFFKDMRQYLEQNTAEDMTQDEMNDSYYELAEYAKTRAQALKYVKKAVRLFPVISIGRYRY